MLTSDLRILDMLRHSMIVYMVTSLVQSRIHLTFITFCLNTFDSCNFVANEVHTDSEGKLIAPPQLKRVIEN